jgi:hypothetical protein
MEVMPCQYQMLLEALSGYEKTGMSLIAYDGRVFKPAGLGDDLGIYYFIPKMAHAFDISTSQSINIFFIGIISISLFFGIMGCFLLFKKQGMKFIGLFELILLALFSIMVGGTYIIFSSIAIAIIPLFLSFTRRPKLKTTFIIFLLVTGFVIGIAHFLRSHSGTGVLIYIIIFLLFGPQIQWKQKLFLFLVITIGFLTPVICFDRLLNQRDNYLKNNYPNYEQVLRQHPFWHSVYIGLGFLENEYGIKYRDEVAAEKVRAISPSTPYLSKEYERILRNEVFKLIIRHPLFFAITVFAKLGVIIFYLLISANVGLITVPFYLKRWPLEFSFWSAMAFNALFGILVVPDYRYLMGFIAMGCLYGIMGIHQIMEHGSIWNFVRRLRQGGKISSCVV